MTTLALAQVAMAVANGAATMGLSTLQVTAVVDNLLAVGQDAAPTSQLVMRNAIGAALRK
jgi:hypothetical protein